MNAAKKPINRRWRRRMARALMAPLVFAWTVLGSLLPRRARLNQITSVRGLAARGAGRDQGLPPTSAPAPAIRAEIPPPPSAEIIDFPLRLAR